MDKRFLICAAVILLFALLGLLAYNKLEIYQYKTYISPSREAFANNYFAMEKWLNETGHPVRVEKQFSSAKLAAAAERVVMVQSKVCSWDNASEFIIPWIEQGGYLVVCMDYFDENFLELLSGYGVGVEEKYGIRKREESIPYFDNLVFFTVDDNADIFTINDDQGFARLVEISLGNGALTVTGMPVFMYNNNLKKDINASLAWNLTGARANGENMGVLFVWEIYIPKALFGKIMERGNLLPVGISAFLAIFLGFWMVIPVFGLVFAEKQRIARPIRERFIAEIRFLKKYGALDHHLDVYEREQNPGEMSKNKKAYKYRELINQYRRIFDGTAKF